MFKFIGLTILVLIGLVAAVKFPDDRCPEVNPVPAKRLPHESDCTLHYVCHNGYRVLMPPCPEGMKFDAPSLRCVTAGSEICGEKMTTPHPITTVPPPDTTASVVTTTTITFPSIPTASRKFRLLPLLLKSFEFPFTCRDYSNRIQQTRQVQIQEIKTRNNRP